MREHDAAVLLDVVELGLVSNPRRSDSGQRLAQLRRAVEDPAASQVRLPHDIVARGLEERIDAARLVRAPQVTNKLDQAPHGAKG